MRLYIIRHADPDYINGTITERGHKEASSLSLRLEKEGINKIYTSPLNRAFQTMKYSADRLNLRFETLDWIEEISGLRLELPMTERKGLNAAWDIPGELLLDKDTYRGKDISIENAYMLEEYKNEVLKITKEIEKNSDIFLESLGYKKEDHNYRIINENEDKVAVFCHNGSGLTWLSYLLSIPYHIMWSSFWMAPSSVSTVLFDKRSSRRAVPRSLNIGDTSHLYSDSLEISPRGIITNFY